MPDTYYIWKPMASDGVLEYLPVRGVAVNWPGLPTDRLFLHKTVEFTLIGYEPIHCGTWTVSDIRTGLQIESGESPREALENSVVTMADGKYEEAVQAVIRKYGEAPSA